MKNKLNTKKEFDWMFKYMIADMPITNVEYLRPNFTKWWKQLCRLIDEQRNVELEVELNFLKKKLESKRRYWELKFKKLEEEIKNGKHNNNKI